MHGVMHESCHSIRSRIGKGKEADVVGVTVMQKGEGTKKPPVYPLHRGLIKGPTDPRPSYAFNMSQVTSYSKSPFFWALFRF